MPRDSPIQVAFNGGLLGARLQGRVDLAKYRTGCQQLCNFIPTVQGPAVKRSGTAFVCETKDSSQRVQLIPFEFSREQAYVLEFGPAYMRVYRDSGVVLESTQSIVGSPTAANPVVLTVSSHGYSTNDSVRIDGSGMEALNGRTFRINVTSSDTFELIGEDGTGRVTGSGGSVAKVYEIPTQYEESDLFTLQYAQTADVLYIACPTKPPYKIARTSDTDWTAEKIVFDAPPFQPDNVTDTTLSIDAATGTAITVTASDPIFSPSNVGQFLRLTETIPENHPKWTPDVDMVQQIIGSWGVGARCYYEDNVYSYSRLAVSNINGSDPPVHREGERLDKKAGYTFVNSGSGWGEIVAYISPTQVTVDVDTAGREFPSETDDNALPVVTNPVFVTKKWALGAFGGSVGYPRAVTIFEDRLWWGGTVGNPQTFWASRTGDYENHEVIGVQEDAGLTFTLASDKINSIEWMIATDILVIGTRGSEFTVRGGGASEAISPSNIQALRQSSYGSRPNLQPIQVDSAIFFVQQAGRRIEELIFDFDTDGYVANDLTQFSENILLSGVVQQAYQSSPFRQLWVALADGTMAAATYVREEDVLGWMRAAVGGTDARVESLAVIPHPDGDEDQLWLVVNREINGVRQRYVEVLEKPFEQGDLLARAKMLESSASFEAPQVTAAVTPTYVGGDLTEQLVTTSSPHGLSTNDVIAVVDSQESPSANGQLLFVNVTSPTEFIAESPQGTNYTKHYLGDSFVYGETVQAISGAGHLRLQTVDALLDGRHYENLVVTDSGTITLPVPASIVQLGYAQPAALLQTMRWEFGMGQIGTAQGRRGRFHQLCVRLDQCGTGLEYGGNFERMDALESTVPLFDDGQPYVGDTPSLDMPSGYEREKRVALRHGKPLPCTVVALMPQGTTEAR